MKKTITYKDGIAQIGGLMVPCHTTARLVLDGGVSRGNINDMRALAAAVIAQDQQIKALSSALQKMLDRFEGREGNLFSQRMACTDSRAAMGTLSNEVTL